MVFPKHVDRQIRDRPIVRGARKPVPEGEQVVSAECYRPEMKFLSDLIEPGVAALRFEKAAVILLGVEGHAVRLRISREYAHVELFCGKQRLHVAALRKNPAVGYGCEKTALALVGGYRLGVERVDVRIGTVLGIEGENASEAMARIDVPVDLRL